MKMNLPENVKRIIAVLQENGFEASVVGGCVRDCILGRIPQDWDITSSARPEQVKALFEHTIDTGIEHGTVTVMMDHVGYEVTTYRIDGEYLDARHPKEVTFTSNLVEDLKRRDFTINAMAYNDRDGLVDVFGGVMDLEAGIIRCVGNPLDRFSEDALRMLRALRFSAQLGFAVDEETKRAIETLAVTIGKVSAERIQVELVKLLTSDHPDRIRMAYELGLTAIVLPEFDAMMKTGQNNRHHKYTVGEHTIETLQACRKDKMLRLTMLLHDVAKPVCKVEQGGVDHFKGHPVKGKEMAGLILRRLKFDNDTIKKVCHLILYHDYRPDLDPVSVRRAFSEIGPMYCPLLFEVKLADIEGQSDYQREEKIAYVKQLQSMFCEMQKTNICLTRQQLAIDGKDLMEMGLPQGKEIGRILQALFERVLEEPERNTKEKLKELAHNMITPYI